MAPQPASQKSRRSKPVEVWVGVQHYAPDNPPRHPRVEHVFATEEKAEEWRREGSLNSRAWGPWRSITCMEVEH